VAHVHHPDAAVEAAVVDVLDVPPAQGEHVADAFGGEGVRDEGSAVDVRHGPSRFDRP
jgi:hypothetical protein